jgi:hemoglobin
MNTDRANHRDVECGQPRQFPTQAGTPAGKAEASLYELIGGAPVVAAAVEELYLRALANPRLAAYFAQTSIVQLKEHQRVFLTWLVGGPVDAAGYSLRAAHAGLGITNADFDRIVQHLIDSLTHIKIDAALVERIIAEVGPLRSEVVED